MSENEGSEEKEPVADEKKHVDEDWKREAREEKERLAKEKAEEPQPKARPGGAMPQASFSLVVSNYAVQALIALGAMANPVTRKREVNLDLAKHAIDLLGVIEEKTAGNLTDAEKKLLQDTLYDLRMQYVQHVQQA